MSHAVVTIMYLVNCKSLQSPIFIIQIASHAFTNMNKLQKDIVVVFPLILPLYSGKGFLQCVALLQKVSDPNVCVIRKHMSVRQA